MTRVRIKTLGYLQDKKGRKEFYMDIEKNQSLKRLLEGLDPKLRKEIAGGSIVILVNGCPLESLDNLKTKLNDGDTVLLVPPVAGGW